MLTLMLIIVPEDKETLKYIQEPFRGQDYEMGSWEGRETEQDGTVYLTLKNVTRMCVCVFC